MRGEVPEVYNLATGVETSILELANLIGEVTENMTSIELLPAREWDRSGRRFGSTVKSLKILDSPRVEISDGLRRTIEWTKANMLLIESAIVKHDYFMR